ncbi:MAG: zinc-binding dehydrogenase [Candidatus Latescibacterota bacterium]
MHHGLGALPPHLRVADEGRLRPDHVGVQATVIDECMLRPTPPSMDFESAAMVDPVAVAVRAVQLGQARVWERAGGHGAGNVGLLVVQVARALGAGLIVVTDIPAQRLALVRQLGVDEAVDVRAGHQSARFDRIFDILAGGLGTRDSVNQGLGACVRGGHIGVAGRVRRVIR